MLFLSWFLSMEKSCNTKQKCNCWHRWFLILLLPQTEYGLKTAVYASVTYKQGQCKGVLPANGLYKFLLFSFYPPWFWIALMCFSSSLPSLCKETVTVFSWLGHWLEHIYHCDTYHSCLFCLSKFSVNPNTMKMLMSITQKRIKLKAATTKYVVFFFSFL